MIVEHENGTSRLIFSLSLNFPVGKILSGEFLVFANGMTCSLIPAGSDLPPFHPVRRSQASDRGVPPRTHGPSAALHHPRRDRPHQPQSPAVARLPARRGLPELTLCRGKCLPVSVFPIDKQKQGTLDECNTVSKKISRHLDKHAMAGSSLPCQH
jgi:hypothetical protein